MNRPRRPNFPPPRRRPSGPPTPTTQPGQGPPRRRSAFDTLPQVDPPFKVLGSGVERQSLMSAAQPLELVVIQGFTREIEEAFQGFKGRAGEEFWARNPQLIGTAQKLDEVLARIQERKGA